MTCTQLTLGNKNSLVSFLRILSKTLKVFQIPLTLLLTSNRTINEDRMQRRASLNIIVLGDDSVGKSSIIATFVYRQFVQALPGIIPKIQLPPDLIPFIGDNVITTIVDTKDADPTVNRLFSSEETLNIESDFAAMIEDHKITGHEHAINSIVLVYDLLRGETLHRVEEYWLPMIERYCGGEIPVIIAGNKLDIIQRSNTTPSMSMSPDSDFSITRIQRKLVSLLQRFKFVREVVMCSAQDYVNIDEIFTRAIHSIIYPITPLYNLEECRLSEKCKKAFTRIFRMYDWDNDGLLNHDEMDNFQHSVFCNPHTLHDLDSWRKVIDKRLDDARSSNETEHETTLLRSRKFTLSGFLSVLEDFVSKNRLDVPWKILRLFGYDDKLELMIPQIIYEDDGSIPHHKTGMRGRLQSLENAFYNSCGLSHDAKRFLIDLFYRFDSDCDEILTKQNLMNIFSILPKKLPPWHPDRHAEAFSNSFSIPKVRNQVSELMSSSSSTSGPSLSVSGISICSLGSISTVDTNDDSVVVNDFSRPFTFDDWMGHWYLMASLSAVFTRIELYLLGYTSDQDAMFRSSLHSSRQYVGSITDSFYKRKLPSRATRIFLFCSDTSSERKKFVDFLLRVDEADGLLCPSMSDDISSSRDSKNYYAPSETWYTSVHMKHEQKGGDGRFMEHKSYLIITEISDTKPMNNLRDLICNPYDHKCDLVILAFDSVNVDSAEYVLEIERTYLSNDVPRLFIALDDDRPIAGIVRSCKSAYDIIRNHCVGTGIEKPLLVLSSQSNDEHRQRILIHLSKCTLKDSCLHVIPRRKDNKFWYFLGGITFVVGFGFYYTLSSFTRREEEVKVTSDPRRFRWFRDIFAFAMRSRVMND